MGVGGWVGRDENEDKKNVKMWDEGWEKKNQKGGQLGREIGEEREGEGIREGSLGM